MTTKKVFLILILSTLILSWCLSWDSGKEEEKKENNLSELNYKEELDTNESNKDNFFAIYWENNSIVIRNNSRDKIFKYKIEDLNKDIDNLDLNNINIERYLSRWFNEFDYFEMLDNEKLIFSVSIEYLGEKKNIFFIKNIKKWYTYIANKTIPWNILRYKLISDNSKIFLYTKKWENNDKIKIYNIKNFIKEWEEIKNEFLISNTEILEKLLLNKDKIEKFDKHKNNYKIWARNFEYKDNKLIFYIKTTEVSYISDDWSKNYKFKKASLDTENKELNFSK